MSGEHELNRDVDIDLGGIFGSIWRNKFKLLFASIVVTALVFMVLQVMSPRYRSEARILIRASDSILTTPSASTVQRTPDFDNSGIASQVQLLQSRTIATKVIDDLNLKNIPEFETGLNRSSVDRILALVGLSDEGRGVTAEDRVLESYFNKLKVFQADRARVIVVQFWSKDPKLAAAIPNKIVDQYLALQEELKRGANPAELEKLEPELKALRASVMQAEAAVEEFRENSDLLQGSNNNSLATQELSELSTELGRVRSQLSRAQANAASVRRALNSGSLDAAASVLQSPLIQRLRERQVTLRAQLSELSTTLLSGHPRIQRLNSQISSLERQIRTEARKIEASLQQEANVAAARAEDLVQRRNELKSEAGRVGRSQVELRSLEREADAQRQLLNSYLVRFKEAKSRQNREFLPADAFVFSKAKVQSKPYFPKKIPTLAGAFFGTFILGSMFTLAGSILSGAAARQVAAAPRQNLHHEMSHDAAQQGEMGPSSGGVQHVAPTPSIAPSMESLTGVHPNPSGGVISAVVAARSIAMLGRARIAVLTPETESDEAGTTVLARFLSANGASVVVIDMSGQAGSTKSMLGQTHMPGIKDLMSGTATFGDVIHADSASSAHILPVGTAAATIAAESAEQLPKILDALQETYNYVIVDCGSADAGGLARVSDPSTVNIINAANPENPIVHIASDMLKHAGFRMPLIVHATAEERGVMGLEAA